MIPIRDIAGALNPSPEGRRYVAVFRFFCDESYDSDPKKGTGMLFYEQPERPLYIPRTYVVGGFFSDELTWAEVEKRWQEENERVGVRRYHAANVNARSEEFEGWDKETQQIPYSKNLIQILLDQKRKLHALSCSMWATDYYRIISDDGRRKLGKPYIACFKTCIATVAREMEIRNFEPDDKFAVILDRNDFEDEAVKVFYEMKDTLEWPYCHRLATCAPGSWKEFVPLQCADLTAYETFRLIHDGAKGEMVRKALKLMFIENGFLGYDFEPEGLRSLKTDLEQADCKDNGFVVSFPPIPDEEGPRSRQLCRTGLSERAFLATGGPRFNPCLSLVTHSPHCTMKARNHGYRHHNTTAGVHRRPGSLPPFRRWHETDPFSAAFNTCAARARV